MSYFVVRDTFHPDEDLKRNWSSFAGGSCSGEQGGASVMEAKKNYAKHLGVDVDEISYDFKFHPAYDEYVVVHYEGLGAFKLEAATLEEALLEAAEYEDGLAVCSEAGNGHFFAEDCLSFHKVRNGRYVFEIVQKSYT